MIRSLLFAMFCVSLMLTGCPDDGSGYAYDHRSDVRYDCEETIACRQSNAAPVGDDPVETCIKTSGKRLDGYSGSERSLFEATFERCSQYRVCQYFACTQSDGSYATSHALEINKHCQETSTCRVARGEVISLNATSECVIQTGAMLDMATATDRTVFEARFARCVTLAGCAYVDCP